MAQFLLTLFTCSFVYKCVCRYVYLSFYLSMEKEEDEQEEDGSYFYLITEFNDARVINMTKCFYRAQVNVFLLQFFLIFPKYGNN